MGTGGGGVGGIGVGGGGYGWVSVGGGGGGGGGALHERHSRIAPAINIRARTIQKMMFAHFGRKSKRFIRFSLC